VRTVELPSSFVEDAGGAFTRKGTPRLEVLAASRAAFLQRKADEADSEALQFDSGTYTFRREGEHIKSIQGHAEDVWRRIYKRPVPEGDSLQDPDFRRFYDRTRRALKRSDLLEDRGPAVEDPNKKVQDRHGKRWALSDALQDAESGVESGGPPSFVRCTGDPVEDGTADVWARVERRVAREKELHTEFTHAVTTRELDGPRWTGEGRRFERRHARDGSDVPRHISIGRWRPEAVGRADRRGQAVRVPWIVAEIDGRDDQGRKDRAVSDRLARRLLRRLDAFGVDLSDVVVAYSGNASIHVRIPDGAVGCPIYRDAQAARESIGRLFDRLCGADDALRTAVDDACFRPGQTIRAVGSIHPDTGRQTVATTADVFTQKPAAFLWSLSESQFQYTPPERFPVPRRGSFVPALAVLLTPSSTPTSEGGLKTNVQQYVSGGRGVSDGGPVGVRRRLRGGVREGEPWGMDVGRPYAVGRNWAALFYSHLVLAEQESREAAWRVVQDWNRRFNAPSLPGRELEDVFRQAVRFQRGHVS
jgi:hypothetical protein